MKKFINWFYKDADDDSKESVDSYSTDKSSSEYCYLEVGYYRCDKTTLKFQGIYRDIDEIRLDFPNVRKYIIEDCCDNLHKSCYGSVWKRVYIQI